MVSKKRKLSAGDNQAQLNEMLLKAVEEEDDDQVEKYLTLGADVNATNSLGKNSLHIAAEKRNGGIFALLLENGKADTTVESYDGEYLCEALPIHYAAYHGAADIIEQILAYDEGKTINDLDGRGLSALHEAIDQDNIAAVKVLLKHPKVNINVNSAAGEGDIDFPIGSTPIIQAIITDKPEVVELLVQEKKLDVILQATSRDINDNSFTYDEVSLPDSSNILHLATVLGSKEIVSILLKHLSKKVVNQKNNKADDSCTEMGNATSLAYAAAQNDESMVLIYIKSQKVVGLDQYVDVDRNNTILHLACCYGWVKVLQELAKIKEVNFQATNRYGHSVIKIAQHHKQTQIIAELRKIMQTDESKRVDPNEYNPKASVDKQMHIIAEKRKEFLQTYLEVDWPYLDDLSDDMVIEETNLFAEEGCFLDEREDHKGESSDDTELTGVSDTDELINDIAARTASKKEHLNLLLDDENEREENLPAHVAAYARNDIKTAKMLHAFPGLDITHPLPGMRSPESFIVDEKMRKLYEEARHRKYDEITTVGSSSVASDIQGRAAQEAALVHAVENNQVDLSEQEINELLEQLNEEVKHNKQVADEVFPFVIPHFRGINFNRTFFDSKQKPKFVEQALKVGIRSKMSHLNANIAIGKFLTEEEDKTLTEYDNKVKVLWSEILNQKMPVERYWEKNKGKANSEKTELGKPKYLLQERYTNLANKTYEKGKYIDIWQEMWPKILERKDEILANSSLNHQSLFEELTIQESPLASFGKTPGHAVRYCVGRSLSGALRSTRGDPFYRNTGKPKHRLIGLAYITLHTVTEYFAAKPSDVLKLHRKKAISANYRYHHETEVSFPGGVPKSNIVAAIPIYFPNFENGWAELDVSTIAHYQKWYGLTKEQYTHFANGFKNTTRPEPVSIDIFNLTWKAEYEGKHGLVQEKFDLFKKLVAAIHGQPLSKKELDNLLTQLDVVNKKTNKPKKVIFDKKDSIKNKEALIKAINEKLREINPYRMLKNELRDYFGGYNDSKTGKFVEGHLSKLLLIEAREHAKKLGKILIYRDADKKFKLYKGVGSAVRKQIVNTAKDHSDFVNKKRKQEAAVKKGVVKNDANKSVNEKTKTDAKKDVNAKQVKPQLSKSIHAFFPPNKKQKFNTNLIWQNLYHVAGLKFLLERQQLNSEQMKQLKNDEPLFKKLQEENQTFELLIQERIAKSYGVAKGKKSINNEIQLVIAGQPHTFIKKPTVGDGWCTFYAVGLRNPEECIDTLKQKTDDAVVCQSLAYCILQNYMSSLLIPGGAQQQIQQLEQFSIGAQFKQQIESFYQAWRQAGVSAESAAYAELMQYLSRKNVVISYLNYLQREKYASIAVVKTYMEHVLQKQVGVIVQYDSGYYPDIPVANGQEIKYVLFNPSQSMLSAHYTQLELKNNNLSVIAANHLSSGATNLSKHRNL